MNCRAAAGAPGTLRQPLAHRRLGPATVAAAALLAAALLGCDRPAVTPQPSSGMEAHFDPGALPGVLDAYRYELRVHAPDLAGGAGGPSGPAHAVNITVTGEIAGTRHRALTRLGIGFGVIESERVQVDGRTWTRDASHPWVEERATAVPGAMPLVAGVDPALFTDPAFTSRLARVLSTIEPVFEDVGGAELLRYEIEAEQARALLASNGPASALRVAATLWLMAESHLPVRFTIAGTTSEGPPLQVHITIRDHNSPEIEVHPPQ